MRPYGVIQLTPSSPAQQFTEPLDLHQIQKHLNLPEQSGHDEVLNAMITAARVLAEAAQNRDLIVKQYDLNIDHFSVWWPGRQLHQNFVLGGYIEYAIPLRNPLVRVDLLRYRDATGAYTMLTEGPDYIVDTARGLVLPPYGQTWPSFTPWPSSAVLIRFSSGMTADDPFWLNEGQVILGGMKYLITQWFTNRIPFEPAAKIEEYPYSVTSMLGFGAIPRVK
ncbi:MAG TPA: hypothetical protein VNH83_18875 [Bryobacteraceae bacterium]|nr:hypothetical protein [Bryobacteraceae bacterium]